MFTAAKNLKSGDNYLISPLTSEKIPANKVQEHMRIGLLDPRWVEQRDKHIQDRINQETVYAGGINSFSNFNYILGTRIT